MSYSTIQRKKCKGGCTRYPVLGMAGYCFKCCPTEIKERVEAKKLSTKQKSIQRQREKQKVRSLIPTQNMDEVKRQKELNDWFAYVATVIAANNHCWECNSFISKSDYRNSSAHIFPKSSFPSIAIHPLNFLVLGNRCGCHERSHTIENFSKMKVWKMAVLRFVAFEKDITETHKYLELFKLEIKC